MYMCMYTYRAFNYRAVHYLQCTLCTCTCTSVHAFNYCTVHYHQYTLCTLPYQYMHTKHLIIVLYVTISVHYVHVHYHQCTLCICTSVHAYKTFNYCTVHYHQCTLCTCTCTSVHAYKVLYCTLPSVYTVYMYISTYNIQVHFPVACWRDCNSSWRG